MKYLSNAFSLQMIDSNNPGVINYCPLSIAEAKVILEDGFESAIGHKDTAAVVSNLIKMPVKENRVSIKLNKEDILIVAQIIGGRLPEGTTTIPEGMEIKFILITRNFE